MYYVYLHKLYDGTVFYVGKGKNRRAWSRHNRNNHWKNITNKHPWYVEIVEKDLQEWYAIELELDLIYFYGLKKYNEGSLVNMCYVAKEQPSFIFPEIVRKIISEKTRGLKNGNLRKDIFLFKNLETGEEFRGIAFEFQQRYKINPRDIINKRVYTVCGWYIPKHGLPRKLPTDYTVYLFKHATTGETFEGTRKQFQDKFNISVKNLFSKRRKGTKSWSVICKLKEPFVSITT